MINILKELSDFILKLLEHKAGQFVLGLLIAGFGTWYVMDKRLDVEIEHSQFLITELSNTKEETVFWRNQSLKSRENCLEEFRLMQEYLDKLTERAEKTYKAIDPIINRAESVVNSQREYLNGLKKSD